MSWEDEFVIVKNETDDDIEWHGKKYAAGSQATVPYLVMVNSFGDPRSVPGSHQVYIATNGERGVIQPREVERLKVQTYWARPDTPRPTFYNMDGDRLYTVADDPEGSHIAPANPTVEQQAVLQRTVERQQEVINRLLEVAGLDKDALPPETAPIPPADIPTDDSSATDTQSPFAHAANDDLPIIDEQGEST